MLQFVMNHFSFTILKGTATLFTHVGGWIDVTWWWLLVHFCVVWKSPAYQQVRQISPSSIRHDWGFWKQFFSFFVGMKYGVQIINFVFEL